MKKVNTNNFKKTLSKFSTGITVVCVKNNNSIYGKTVNSFNSLSLNPPMVLFSLGNYSSSIKKFSKTKFLISITYSWFTRSASKFGISLSFTLEFFALKRKLGKSLGDSFQFSILSALETFKSLTATSNLPLSSVDTEILASKLSELTTLSHSSFTFLLI